jgi:hypothetical protein
MLSATLGGHRHQWGTFIIANHPATPRADWNKDVVDIFHDKQFSWGYNYGGQDTGMQKLGLSGTAGNLSCSTSSMTMKNLARG